MMLRNLLSSASAIPLRAPEGTGGAAAPAAASPPAASTTGTTATAAPTAVTAKPAEGAAASTSSEKAADPARGSSVLDTVKPTDPAAAAKPTDGDGTKPGDAPQETAEQKTAREAQERQKQADELLKTYNEGDKALKLPEGFDKDQPAFADFKKASAELGLPSDQAQKLVDTVAPKLKEALEAPYKTWGELQEKWVGEIKADPELGGKNYDQNLGTIVTGIHALFPKAEEAQRVKDALAFTGAGNNPEVLRYFFRAGKALSEGGAPVTGRTAPADKGADIASKFYPNMASGAQSG